ncbi:MAG: Electron transport protein SCO1/SenC [Pedosphaera sp.]|nr:Electron transport protein SCO1/SenC [Pedosphaera sp.]
MKTEMKIRKATGAASLKLVMLAVWLAMVMVPAVARAVSDEELRQIKFDQKLQQQVSLDLPFRDETGKIVKLGDYLGKRPTILVLGYYGCPMLCTLVLNGLVESLQDLKSSAGGEFEIINVSIDPHETTALAAAKKKAYLKRYGRHGVEQGWHFLTGDEAAIRKLTQEVGFRYVYDEPSRQYAHPSGLVILTPQGKVSRYLPGVTYAGKDLNAALVAASANKVGTPVEQFFLLCFHYSPSTGKYGALVMMAVRAGGVLTLLVLGRGMVIMIRRESARKEPVTPVRTGPG